MDTCSTCAIYNNCIIQSQYGNKIGCSNWEPHLNLIFNPSNKHTDKKDKIINNLVHIIQRIEREQIDNVTVDDIKTVWEAKTLLGYSHPVSIEEGTGMMLPKI